MDRLVVRSALATAVALFGGVFVGFALGSLINGLPFHAPEGTKVAIASLFALAGTVLGGALWGYLLARIYDLNETKRMTLAGALGFGPAVIAAGLLLSALERLLFEEGRLPGVPIHVLFTLLFVPATFAVASVGGTAIALGSRNGRQWLRFGLSTGAAGAIAFLATNLSMDALGWRVGGPRAADRATMLTVMFLGALTAALLAGGVLGRLLRKLSATSPNAA